MTDSRMLHPHYDQRVLSGILPSQNIESLIADGHIRSQTPIPADQIQPASLDLRLGPVAYRVPASFLPGPNRTVAERLADLRMHHEIDLTRPAMLERDCVYIIPLQEELALPSFISGKANPKSSTGRLDIFTRVITDRCTTFDEIRPGYTGPLYLEVVPRTFSVIVREGTRLSQLRLTDLNTPPVTYTHADLHRNEGIAFLADGSTPDHLVSDGLWFTVDLKGDDTSEIVGFRARPHGLIDLENVGGHDPRDYWEPIYRSPNGTLVLTPDEFYILVSRERIRIPLQHSAEMMPYETPVGEFRVHYAGFFDPGFGCIEGAQVPGTPGVLEVRCHEAPFLLEHGQVVGRLRYEEMLAVPNKIYGRDIGSNYQGQGLKLAKHFRPW